MNFTEIFDYAINNPQQSALLGITSIVGSLMILAKTPAVIGWLLRSTVRLGIGALKSTWEAATYTRENPLPGTRAEFNKYVPVQGERWHLPVKMSNDLDESDQIVEVLDIAKDPEIKGRKFVVLERLSDGVRGKMGLSTFRDRAMKGSRMV